MSQLDLWGADWDPCGTGYTLQPTALRYESYEISFAAKVGLGVAVDYVNRTVGMAWAWERIRALAALLRRGLAAVPGVVVRDHGRVQGGIVTFTKASLRGLVQGCGSGSNCCPCSETEVVCNMWVGESDLKAQLRRGLPAIPTPSQHHAGVQTESCLL